MKELFRSICEHSTRGLSVISMLSQQRKHKAKPNTSPKHTVTLINASY